MPANGTPLIQLQGVRKIFFTDEVETHALADVHLEIREGEYVAINGPSGCGKTTLLSILGLLDTPSDGSYLLEDKPVANLTPAERARIRNRRIGFVFQAFNLIGDLTVAENVELPLTYRGMSGAERTKRVQQALEKVGMSHRAKHYPVQLSGGQQQRVAVARAVVGDPAILLADEPTGNLDSTNGEAVMELLRTLNRSGATVCMVTHDPRYEDLRDHARSFAVAAYGRGSFSLGLGPQAEPVKARLVTASFFSVLGVRPELGRFFGADEDSVGRAAHVAVLSREFWMRRFGADRAVLGKTLQLGRNVYTVIGVTPQGFAGIDLEVPDLWLPLTAAAPEVMGPAALGPRFFWLAGVVARLRPRVSLEQAAAEATAIYRSEFVQSGDSTGTVSLGPVHQAIGPLASRLAKLSSWLVLL